MTEELHTYYCKDCFKKQEQIERLEQENKDLKKQIESDKGLITVGGKQQYQYLQRIDELEQENKTLYEEKNCLHKIIDRLLENAGYSKDIASAEDFEDVYEDMQIKRNELIELEQENNAYKQSEQEASEIIAELKSKNKELKKLNKTICEDWEKEIKYYWEALEEILESAKFAQCLPCGSGNLEDCLNCNDDTTNNGQFCMEKRIHEIKTKCVEVLNEKEL